MLIRRFVSAMSLAGAALLSAPAQADPVAGVYTVEGGCPGTAIYRGTLVVAGDGPVFNLTWTIGDDVFKGHGLAREGVLSIIYTSDRYSGLMQMRNVATGQWDGIWVVAGNDTTCKESWTTR